MEMMIVDDEVLTLQLLHKILDWDSMSIKIVGEALSGSEVLGMIEKKVPDILITDIKMPEMDGLELIKRIRDHKYRTRIIILSAYGEFEYAQRAMTYGVNGYLLKPIDEEKLKALIENVTKEVENERMERGQYEIKKSVVTENIVTTTNENQDTESSRCIKKAKEYINAHYSENITLEEICNHIGMSKNYFSHLFKTQVKQNVWDYLTEVRIERSKELLEQTILKNYEISYMVGYENPSYFTKMFKKATGMTPHDYRTKG